MKFDICLTGGDMPLGCIERDRPIAYTDEEGTPTVDLSGYTIIPSDAYNSLLDRISSIEGFLEFVSENYDSLNIPSFSWYKERFPKQSSDERTYK